MANPRLLIPISIQFNVRYVLRTGLLSMIQEYAQPIVLLAWEDGELKKEFERAGAEVYQLPKARCGESYNRIRNHLNTWFHQRLQCPTRAIDARRYEIDVPLKSRLYKRFRQRLLELYLALPTLVDASRQKERELLRTDTNIEEFETLVASVNADAALSITPFLRDEEFLLKACAARGIPLYNSMLSFDNLTTRGWLSVVFDQYLLWNGYNQKELRRAYPEAAMSSVTLVGSPQFDFYRDPNYLWDEKTWRRELSLPPHRPVILFGGNYHLIVPHEPHWLKQLDEAIEKGELPEQPIILFRRHPVDPIERWTQVLNEAKHVVYDDPWLAGQLPGQTNVRRRDIEKLASSLFHSQVHVNAGSTMTVDGAVFDRPQIGPAYDDRPGRKFDLVARELYLREHFLPITHSGGLEIVYSREQMIEAIRSALENPGRLTEERKCLVREICTYDDGQGARRVSQSLRSFLSQCPVGSQVGSDFFKASSPLTVEGAQT
jgi:hypothetical protein